MFGERIVEGVIGFFTKKSQARSKLKEAKQNMKLADLNNKARLLNDENSNNHEWEMANLTDKDKWLRRISFAMFAAPFVWALFDPAGVKEYFEIALASMPEWYIKLFASMVGAVWGISSLKNSLPAVIGGIKRSIKS